MEDQKQQSVSAPLHEDGNGQVDKGEGQDEDQDKNQQDQFKFLMITHKDTDILTLDAAKLMLPIEFPPIETVDLCGIKTDTDMIDLLKSEKVTGGSAAHQQVVILVRLLGRGVPGFQRLLDYARKNNHDLIVVSGVPGSFEPDLTAMCTVSTETINQVMCYFNADGCSRNMENMFRFLADHLMRHGFGYDVPTAQPDHGLYHPRFTGSSNTSTSSDRATLTASYLEKCATALDRGEDKTAKPTVAVIFYRCHFLSGNTSFVDALIDELEALNVNAIGLFTESLREHEFHENVNGKTVDRFPTALTYLLNKTTGKCQVDSIISTMAFAMGEVNPDGPTLGSWSAAAVEAINVPVLQAINSVGTRLEWEESARGLNPLDTAMNVAIPEFDGRIITVPISFKAAQNETNNVHYYEPVPDRVAQVAKQAVRWARLRHKPNRDKRVIFILTNSSAKAQRIGDAVGLDTPASIMKVFEAMQADGYDLGDDLPADGDTLMQNLIDRCSYDEIFLTEHQLANAVAHVPAAVYQPMFDSLPTKQKQHMEKQWGAAPGEAYVHENKIALAGLEFGNVFVALQPPRGYGMDPDKIYHTPDLPPPHNYFALYRWLRDEWKADAMVHMGKHGTLEWLPGKGVGLSNDCYPDTFLDDMPLIYPFIINDPGEGTQSKRRAHALIIDHLTPPMTTADGYGELAQLMQLVDEYYQIEMLDPTKLPYIQKQIWELIQEISLDEDLSLLLPQNHANKDDDHHGHSAHSHHEEEVKSTEGHDHSHSHHEKAKDDQNHNHEHDHGHGNATGDEDGNHHGYSADSHHEENVKSTEGHDHSHSHHEKAKDDQNHNHEHGHGHDNTTGDEDGNHHGHSAHSHHEEDVKSTEGHDHSHSHHEKAKDDQNHNHEHGHGHDNTTGDEDGNHHGHSAHSHHEEDVKSTEGHDHSHSHHEKAKDDQNHNHEHGHGHDNTTGDEDGNHHGHSAHSHHEEDVKSTEGHDHSHSHHEKAKDDQNHNHEHGHGHDNTTGDEDGNHHGHSAHSHHEEDVKSTEGHDHSHSHHEKAKDDQNHNHEHGHGHDNTTGDEDGNHHGHSAHSHHEEDVKSTEGHDHSHSHHEKAKDDQNHNHEHGHGHDNTTGDEDGNHHGHSAHSHHEEDVKSTEGHDHSHSHHEKAKDDHEHSQHDDDDDHHSHCSHSHHKKEEKSKEVHDHSHSHHEKDKDSHDDELKHDGHSHDHNHELTESSLAKMDGKDFAHLIEDMDGYLCELAGAQIRDGLHILGQVPLQGDTMVDMIQALTRLPNLDVPSLREAISTMFGLNSKDLLANQGARLHNISPMLICLAGRPLATAGDAVQTIDELTKHLLALMDQQNFDMQAIPHAIGQTFPGLTESAEISEISEVLKFACDTLVPSLRDTTQEIKHLINALNGEFVPAGPSGSPTRGMAHLLPTGRNFYACDPQALPSLAAWEVGQGLAREVLARYLTETGAYPEHVAISVWGTAAMRTHGDDIAQIFALLGIRPVWQRENHRVTGVELIPLEELSRPRIDVTVRISGFFRDAFPHLITLLDEAVNMAINADEPLEQNFIRKHYLQDMAAKDMDEQSARYRIFGCPPGAYGIGILDLIEAQNWQDDSDFAKCYINWGGYAYSTEEPEGIDARTEFTHRLTSVEVAIHNQDDREHDIFDSDDYFQFHGGMIATIRALSGKQPKGYFGDTQDPATPKVRDIKEETLRVYRTRVVNPKWLESISRHGYKGASEMAATVDYLFGFDATANVVSDFMYEQVAESYALNEATQAFYEQSNPWALRGIAERLLEAAQRGMWEKPDPKTLEALRQTLLKSDAMLEGRSEQPS